MLLSLIVCAYNGAHFYRSFLLKDYRQKHPEVTVLDPPDAIKHLCNRQSMLQDVANLNLSDCHGRLSTILLSCGSHFLKHLYEFFSENCRSHGNNSSLIYTLTICFVGKVCVPKQMVIKNDPMSIPDEVFEAGLKLPIGRFFFFLTCGFSFT